MNNLKRKFKKATQLTVTSKRIKYIYKKHKLKQEGEELIQIELQNIAERNKRRQINGTTSLVHGLEDLVLRLQYYLDFWPRWRSR